MHIFGTTCYVQNKMKLEPHCEKGIFVSYDKQSPAYLIYFLKTMAIKKVRCVKFTHFYDNSTLLKSDNNTEDPESLITWCGAESQFKHQRGGANNLLSHLTEKDPI